jgi:hypothetical protein
MRGSFLKQKKRCGGRFKLTLEWPEAPAFFIVILTSSRCARRIMI